MAASHKLMKSIFKKTIFANRRRRKLIEKGIACALLRHNLMIESCILSGCHIPIKCPSGGQEACREYQNFKNLYSIVLMSMVDAKYRSVWGSCGYPGNSHDSIIFQSTALWVSIKDGKFLPKFTQK